MITLFRNPHPSLLRLGVTCLASLGVLALAAFGTALALVASILIFGTNVVTVLEAAIAIATAVPLAAFGAALLHRTLWEGAATLA